MLQLMQMISGFNKKDLIASTKLQ